MTQSSQNNPVDLSESEGKTLLKLARQTIAKKIGCIVTLEEEKTIKKELQNKIFQEERGTFVTLTKHGQLRGCIGTISPIETIASGIRRNAISSAFEDHRFTALKADEFPDIDIEISILTDPHPLLYEDGDDLLKKLRPGIDGVILRSGHAGATFLPQVWDQLPRTEDFLSRLCLKAGLGADSWQTMKPEILIYQVQHFSEE